MKPQPVSGHPRRSRVLAMWLGTALTVVALSFPLNPAGAMTPYQQQIQIWHQERVERLTSDTGWLTVAGFAWLEPGENPMGTDPGSTVRLPEGTAPARAGAFLVEGEGDARRVTVTLGAGVEGTIGDEPVTTRLMTPDDPGPADRLVLGRLTLWVIKRGDGLAIRMRDPESPMRREFQGVETYPVDESHRVTGRLRPFAEPRTIEVPSVLGYVDQLPCPGEVRFTLAGRELSLLPIAEGDEGKTLFFVFRDETSGAETYGGGRFLYAELQEDGTVDLDFNKAYNPPCAFNSYTTCPLPPEGNALPVAVRAGEKAYAGRTH